MSTPTAPTPTGSYWEDGGQPLAKARQRGLEALSDSELVALLLWHEGATAEHLSQVRKLLLQRGGLLGLARESVSRLTTDSPLTEPQAWQLQAAFELSRRRQLVEARQVALDSAEAVHAYVAPRLIDLYHEVFFVLYLSNSGHVLHEQVLSSGGTGGTIIDPKLVFREALNCLAAGLIVCHNHPSGTLEPSQADLDITRKLAHGAKLLDLQLLDHLIISYKGYTSLAEQGAL